MPNDDLPDIAPEILRALQQVPIQDLEIALTVYGSLGALLADLAASAVPARRFAP